MVDTDVVIILIKAFAVPCAVLLIGACAATRLAFSPGALKQRFFSAAVVLSLAVAAAVSVLKIPADQGRLRPGNPYPVGIGGLTPGDRRPGMVTPLSM
jgi:hypothetical protein